ncbi:MAG: TolC family protein [Bacteroidia bacterium]|nr:TolC family protein [Bacteroidia bacterium]
MITFFKYLFCSIIFFLIWNITVVSQEKWTLEKCIDYALKNNIQIKQQELNSMYSKNNLMQSKLNLLPTLNGNASESYSWGRTVDRFTNSFSEDKTMSLNFGLSSSVTIFNGFQNYNTIRQKNFDLLASIQNYEKAKNDISLNISSGYLQILYSIELYEIAANQVEITAQQVERTKKLVDAGSVAAGNLLQVEAQAASEELQVVNAQNQLTMSYLTLVQLLDLDSVENFQISTPDFSNYDMNSAILTAGQVYLEAEKNLPQIKSSEYSLKSAEAGLSIAKGNMSPRLSVSGSYGSGYSDARKTITDTTYQQQTVYITMNGQQIPITQDVPGYNYVTTPFKDQLKNNVNKNLSFSLSVPIFNGWQVRNAINNAKINVLNAQYNLELAKKQLLKEIQQAHADAVASFKKFNSTKKAVASMEEAFKYTQQKFDVGLVNTLDYNTAKNNLAKAKADMLQAKYEYIFKTKILDFYRGNPIKM